MHTNYSFSKGNFAFPISRDWRLVQRSCNFSQVDVEFYSPVVESIALIRERLYDRVIITLPGFSTKK
jgi:hypothetical protein